MVDYPVAILSEHAPKTAKARAAVSSCVSTSPPLARQPRIARLASPASSPAPPAAHRARRGTFGEVETETETETEKDQEKKEKRKGHYMPEEWVSEADLTVIRWGYQQGSLACYSSTKQVNAAKFAHRRDRGERKVRLYLHELEKLNQELTKRGENKIQIRPKPNAAEWTRIARGYSEENLAKIELQKAEAEKGEA